jgi:hypothetical protein
MTGRQFIEGCQNIVPLPSGRPYPAPWASRQYQRWGRRLEVSGTDLGSPPPLLAAQEPSGLVHVARGTLHRRGPKVGRGTSTSAVGAAVISVDRFLPADGISSVEILGDFPPDEAWSRKVD